MTLYRGTVVDLVAGRPVVNIPRLHGSSGQRPVGPLASLTAGLGIGDTVLVADELDGRVDQYVVLGRLLP